MRKVDRNGHRKPVEVPLGPLSEDCGKEGVWPVTAGPELATRPLQPPHHHHHHHVAQHQSLPQRKGGTTSAALEKEDTTPRKTKLCFFPIHLCSGLFRSHTQGKTVGEWGRQKAHPYAAGQPKKKEESGRSCGVRPPNRSLAFSGETQSLLSLSLSLFLLISWQCLLPAKLHLKP